jgi:uncharacterized integral membrane protein
MAVEVKNMNPTMNPVYQGQFGEFTITDSDRQEVILYRTGLAISGLSFFVGAALTLLSGNDPAVLPWLTPLFFLFSAGLGLSLWTIHIYFKLLHRVLQLFWMIGSISALVFAISSTEPLAAFVYHHPLSILGIGFIFAALTGIFFKEGFCFSRLETKLLTPLVPFLLLGHLFGFLPVAAERVFLATWAGLFLVFVYRKVIQAIPPDIGDKSVFAHLAQQQAAKLQEN